MAQPQEIDINALDDSALDGPTHKKKNRKDPAEIITFKALVGFNAEQEKKLKEKAGRTKIATYIRGVLEDQGVFK